VAVSNFDKSTDEGLLLLTAPLLFPRAVVGAAAPLSKVKPPWPLEVEIDVGETTVGDDKGEIVELLDGDEIGIEDPGMMVGPGREAVEESNVPTGGNPSPEAVLEVTGVEDEETTVGKTDVLETAVDAPQLMVTVVVMVMVGNPFVPMAVWIGGGSAKVLLSVVETGGVEGTDRAEVDVAGSVLEVDEAASVGAEDDAEVNTTVDVPAGTVTKVILLN